VKTEILSTQTYSKLCAGELFDFTAGNDFPRFLRLRQIIESPIVRQSDQSSAQTPLAQPWGFIKSVQGSPMKPSPNCSHIVKFIVVTQQQ
jgi:hypothetical protein